jgi:predicted enzyme related to lactoylglutathione lyase
MSRVTGIGGIFIKSPDPDALRAWYRTHLDFDISEWGGVIFRWQTPERPEPNGSTTWSVMPASSTYFDPSPAPFMVNYRVTDLHALLGKLRAEGCSVDDKVEESEYGKFGWVLDCDGNRLELWQPPEG